MKMVTCKNGHFYDKEQYSICPYCMDVEKDSTILLNTLANWVNTQNKNVKTAIKNIDTKATTSKHTQIELLQEGSLFNKYRIIEKIGEGGFSIVYKVAHKSLNHTYALKIFHYKEEKKDKATTLCALSTSSNSNHNIKKELKQLFFNEAYNLAKLTSPNVVKVYDEGVFDNNAYILMEYIQGKRLDKIIENIQNFTVEKTLDLLEDILSVLVEQEKKNIIHGDIKPNNIFLRKNNTFCLIDYGSMNNENIQSYTEYFASPEHISKKLTHKSDLYLLGLTAWYCLTGKFPDPIKWKFEIPTLSNYREDLPQELVKIINSLTQKDINNRYLSAEDALLDVQAYKDDNEKPIGAIKATLFIAISYNKNFDKVFYTLNETAKKLNCKCIRMDRLDFKDEIWKNIALEIEHSDIMIADFTNASRDCHANSNVITEAAHARAVGKDVIVITQNRPEDLPFDWRYLPTIVYNPSPEGLDELSKKIYNKLKRLTSKI